jgi:two-component system nitrogen regulation response regulator GlnG
VVLDLHFALPEERLLPEDKALLPTEKRARASALEELRRRQGLLIQEKLRRDYPTLPVVMLTTTDAELLRSSAGAQDPLLYFCENEVVDSRTLAAEVTRALELHHTTQEGPIFWGRSKPMAELRRALQAMSRSPLPVVVEGETGTGKSFLAEHVIHPRSGTKGPLVVTDLSTVPSTLLPAHLFGARRGAYTGSTEDQPGVFEQAHGGTLFLDEIGNLDLELQRQLLLVLERGAVTRLGDTRPRPAVVKLVAATNMDVEELVREGRFRSDLYMRLNPATRLRVPALRERREDIPELVRFAFLEAVRSESLRPLVRQYLARYPTPDDFRESESTLSFGKPNARGARRDAFSIFLSKPALDRLCAHAWPGNHRELKLLATNALVFTLVHHLDAQPRDGVERAPALLAISDHLLDKLLAGMANAAGPAANKPAAPLRLAGKRGGRTVEISLRPASTFAELSAEVERQYLRALFEATGGDLDAMGAELLGPGGNKRKVHLRMNQLGLRLRELRAGGDESDKPEEPAA